MVANDNHSSRYHSHSALKDQELFLHHWKLKKKPKQFEPKITTIPNSDKGRNLMLAKKNQTKHKTAKNEVILFHCSQSNAGELSLTSLFACWVSDIKRTHSLPALRQGTLLKWSVKINCAIQHVWEIGHKFFQKVTYKMAQRGRMQDCSHTFPSSFPVLCGEACFSCVLPSPTTCGKK